ncbi:unnamed protein product [Ilex paraguariensis]|uniref:PRONE domain-containing protein n=2 Tax=Ilex paraguariensis TaxID=185542 RepID=A0ABC8SSZ0_9AQUA
MSCVYTRDVILLEMPLSLRGYGGCASGTTDEGNVEEKWWLPNPKVPPKGLSVDARKRLQQCRDCTNQILKAALAINSNVLAEMEIPNAYLETLPKVWVSMLGLQML